MNIFVTDPCPRKSANNLDSKRVVKMILESAQLMSNALIVNGLLLKVEFNNVKTRKIKNAYYNGIIRMPALTHAKHPCSLWTMNSRSNYNWLLEHFKGLCNEYTYRFHKIHSYERLYKSYKILSLNLEDKGLTPFANCARNLSLGIDYTNIKDVPKAYKLYLNDRWENDIKKPTWSRKK